MAPGSPPTGASSHPMRLRNGSGGGHPSSFSRTGLEDPSSQLHSTPISTFFKHSTSRFTKNIDTSGVDEADISQILQAARSSGSPALRESYIKRRTTVTKSTVVKKGSSSSNLASPLSPATLSGAYSSSGYDTTEEGEKTDYTYADSHSYRRRVTPRREVPIPNMSRTAMYRYSNSHTTSSYHHHSSEEDEVDEDDLSTLTSKHWSPSNTQPLHRSTPITAATDSSHTASMAAGAASRRLEQQHLLARSQRLASSRQQVHNSTSQYSSSFFSWLLNLVGVNSWREWGEWGGGHSWLLWLLLLLLALGTPLVLWNTSLVNSATQGTWSAPKLGIGATSAVVNVTSLEELRALIDRLLEPKLQTQDTKMKQLSQDLTLLQYSLQGVNQEMGEVKVNQKNSQNHQQQSQEEVQRMAERLEKLEHNLIGILEEMRNCCSNSSAVAACSACLHSQFNTQQHRKEHQSPSSPSVNSSDIRSLVMSTVHQALAQYDADKTGQADYALESAGGSVVSTRCSEAYQERSAQFSVFGIPLWHYSHSPRKVIQPGVSPGECWSFRGSQGYLVIQLSVPVTPTAFTLEHIPASLSPTGIIDSAPKDFYVLGLKAEKDTEGVKLGQYKYDIQGEPLQTFQVQTENPGVFPFVELRIESNHGNPDYTCLYRFRVHGIRHSHY